jgi:hypothetical protein
VCENFSQGAGTPGTQRDIASLQLAVKGLKEQMRENNVVRNFLSQTPSLYLLFVLQQIYLQSGLQKMG